MFSKNLQRTTMKLYQSSNNSFAAFTLSNPAYLNLVRQLSAASENLGGFIYNLDKKEQTTSGKPSKAKTGTVAEVRENDQQHGEGVEQEGRDPNNRKYEEWTEKSQKEVGANHKKASFQDSTGGRKM